MKSPIISELLSMGVVPLAFFALWLDGWNFTRGSSASTTLLFGLWVAILLWLPFVYVFSRED